MIDDVRGQIIGEILYRYEFWTEGNMPRKICHSHFANDEEAVKWFKEAYSDQYLGGVEMRCYDK